MDQDVAAWRRDQRTTFLATRKALTAEQRRQAGDTVAGKLDHAWQTLRSGSVGIYWPINRELNLLHWAEALAEREGVSLCLPVVVTPKAPLEYWRWAPGDAMAEGFWKIPVPAHRELVLPELVLAPLVGFDRANYRLGYGGGYFDRTLAARSTRPCVIGVGYEFSFIETIMPQTHDIPMDAIVTECRATLPVTWSEKVG